MEGAIFYINSDKVCESTEVKLLKEVSWIQRDPRTFVTCLSYLPSDSALSIQPRPSSFFIHLSLRGHTFIGRDTA